MSGDHGAAEKRAVIGRMAPTPSGRLHLGNALAFGAAWISARSAGGRLLLRIEDLDRGRARPEIAEAQREELRWLGLWWDEEVRPQSERRYGLEGVPVWRCACSRARRLSGSCRCREERPAEGNWRLEVPPEPIVFEDRARGRQEIAPELGPILMRADGEAAYPLAVVVDDGRDGVTEVVRGADLLAATPLQIFLHRCLGQALPTWLHVPVLYGPDGKKLSKSHGSTEIAALRAAGWTADRVWATLLPLLGTAPPLHRARLMEDQQPWLLGWRISAEGEILGPAEPGST